ncbi:Tex family protein [Desulfonema magnum]|uniref:RNA-binding transcriptional accessory protein n=1 Tax=Desulfonema magnum TaxID=45655 RepID=A0A975BFC6_9BACT|nr:Tex family protein [Desulfonema magnum]QTA84040.1 RNA-binding transcriptional accessory protein [Desulfonema magnum]
MNETHISIIAEELGLNEFQIQAVATLLDEGATIPFIARYRKEATGSLDEVAVTSVRDRLNQLRELDSRKEAILKSLEQHGHLTDELQEKVMAAETLAVLEDIYLPYKPKRRTKATIAREKGLEPLALLIFEQTGADPYEAGVLFADTEKGVDSVEDALSGARDIIAEMVNENEDARARLRDLFASKGTFKSSVVSDMETEGAKYKDYFDWEESVTTAPSHRILAMRRGEKEDMLNLSITPPEEDAVEILKTLFIKGETEDSKQVEAAIHDCYKRLLSRSMETEIRLATKERADSEAIRVFTENLRQLLLASPLGPRRVMGIDPGFRTGCKIVCLDSQGKFLHNDTIYLHQPEKSASLVSKLCHEFDVEAIAIGNGTAGRETEAFVREILLSARGDMKKIQVVMVNESGASVYSASDVAREEFPDLDLTVRGAVSIGRRLMDPLSELVKIDPKSIGVGQYQHDVDQTALKQSLDDVVMSCVNGVGVDVNTASAQLLTYVSGLGPQLAKNIVAYRDENGPFTSRKGLKNVKRLGPKAFEQCAGFLRIRQGENLLDASAVHPESYHIVDLMAKDLDCTVSDLMKEAELRKKIDISRYVTDAVGIPTLNDILEELAKPGRDPREKFEEFAFEEGVEKIQDLRPGMKLPGIVTNVTAFGAFVDIGVHQDGLVHISELADRFVKTPGDVVKVQQKVTVTVIDVDIERKRISLSMKTVPGEQKQSQAKNKKKMPKPKQKQQKAKDKDRPFNNPFADLLGKF